MTSVILDRRSEIEDRFAEVRATTVAPPRERNFTWRRDQHRPHGDEMLAIEDWASR